MRTLALLLRASVATADRGWCCQRQQPTCGAACQTLGSEASTSLRARSVRRMWTKAVTWSCTVREARSFSTDGTNELDTRRRSTPSLSD